MKITLDQTKSIYAFIEELYNHFSTWVWKWLPGDKKKVKQGFELFCTQLDLHESSMFDAVFKAFRNFCIKTAKNWSTWEDSNNRNFLPYLMKEHRMNGYISHKRNQTTESTGSDSKSPDKWGDF